MTTTLIDTQVETVKVVDKGPYLLDQSGELYVPETDGLRTFVTEKALFQGKFDGDFIECKTNVSTGPTPSAKAVISELIRPGRCFQICHSQRDGKLLWQSQDQCITILERYPLIFRQAGVTFFFPFTFGVQKDFVAGFYRRNNGGNLCAILLPFMDTCLLEPESMNYFVLPKIPPAHHSKN